MHADFIAGTKLLDKADAALNDMEPGSKPVKPLRGGHYSYTPPTTVSTGSLDSPS